MSSAAVGKRSQGASKSGSCASLSVVIVSMGSLPAARRATQALHAASADINAQFIVVAPVHDGAFARAIEKDGAEFVAAPAGCTRAEMCDLGMGRVTGNIVAVRDDVSIGDASWIDAYRRILPRRETSSVAALETLVMDTQVASRAPLADSPDSIERLETGAPGGSVEMAEAV